MWDVDNVRFYTDGEEFVINNANSSDTESSLTGIKEIE